MTNKITTFFIIVILALFSAESGFGASIVKSKHNLSSSGPGTVKGASEKEICIFCHAPHNASSTAPLWNRYDSAKSYNSYKSTTLKAKTGQPTGASKLCLSCHDGTVALGMVRSRSTRIPFSGSIGEKQNLGADLSDDHPISFRYSSSDSQLKNPGTLTGLVRLDKDSQVQCTSCHDPHDDQFGDFLRVNPIRGNLCISCHDMKGWSSSMHNRSRASWNGASPDPWPYTSWGNVADNACENCHTPHNAPGKNHLLKSSREEDTCIPCHNGHVAQKNIFAELNKSSRHVGCLNCHDSHTADTIKRGNNLCFNCHGDSNYRSRKYINRQYAETNIRLKFSRSNKSFHPVMNIGKNSNVPSLIAPLRASSMIKCTDCHNNNSSSPKGPHGSIYRPLLAKKLSLADNQSESLSTYALCYKCHDRSNILANRSFPKHKEHIREQRSPCTACHDPHGVKSSSHLINFDRNIVSRNSSGEISFEDNGRYRGSCSLKCHGREHNEESYPATVE